MTRIFLTGASGFVGRHCEEYLAEQGELYSVTRNKDSGLRGRTVEADVLDIEKVKKALRDIKPELLVHLAWDVRGNYWDSDSNRTWRIASERLFRNFLEFGGKRIVVAGTCGEYDLSLGQKCSEDSTPLENPGEYPEAKRGLNQDLKSLTDNYAWGRFFYLFGEGEIKKRKVPSWIRAIKSGERLSAETDGVRDYTYVKDAAVMFSRMALGKATGQFNIAYGEGLTELDLIRKLANEMKVTGIESKIDLMERRSPATIVADTTKYKECFGPSIPRTDFCEAIRRTVDWNLEKLKQN